VRVLLGTQCLMMTKKDLTDNLGYGMAKRRAGNMATLSGETNFRYVHLPPLPGDE
jgi:hypothetical protein